MFTMLVVELLSLLGINLVCFICLAFTAKKEDLILIQAKQNGLYYDQKRHEFTSGRAVLAQNNSRSDSSFWNNFHSATDLYRVKAVKYDNHDYDGLYNFPNEEEHSSGSPTTKKSSGYNSDSTNHSKTLLSVSSSTDLSYVFKDRCAILQ